MNISQMDLNLLVVLDALLAERNVTRAARRVHLSQPAASNALARLRHAFKDPLLVRGSRGLTLTPRAEELVEPVRQALARIDAMLNPPAPFDPASAQQTFTIAASDAMEVGLLPGLIDRLSREASGVNIVVRPLHAPAPAARPGTGETVPEADLAEGRLELALGYFPDPPERLHTRPLFEVSFVCAVRKDHPTIQGKLTLRQLAQTPHVLVAPQGQSLHGMVDDALARHRLTRRVAVAIPHFFVAPYIVAHSDFIATLPKKMAEGFADTFGLRLLEPPVELPRFVLSQLWHERTHHSPAHRWLRGVIAELCAGL